MSCEGFLYKVSKQASELRLRTMFVRCVSVTDLDFYPVDVNISSAIRGVCESE
jgi:hypothetical protein